MKNKPWLLILLLIVSFNCDKKKSKKDWKELNIELNSVFEIPDTSKLDSEIFFFHPDFVVTDSKGNIVIADRSLNELIVFDKDGLFLRKIGGRGRGPSEFMNINGMSINNSDVIHVFDQSSQTIKRFNILGEFLKSTDLGTASTDIEFEFWDDYTLLFYLKDFRSDIKQNFLLHSYSSEFNKTGEFISYSSLEGLDENLLISYISLKGNSHFVNDDELYFAPTLYNGFIYKYEIKKKQGSEINLHLKDQIPGMVKIIKPGERFNGDNLDYADATVTMAGGKKFQYLFHNQSKGLFQLSNGLIVHFTFIQEKEPQKRVFGVEIYDPEMNSLGYAKIKEIAFDPNRSNMLSWNVMWKDNQDRFYIVDKDANGSPSINVVTLDGIDDI